MKRYTYLVIALFILCQLSLPSQASDGVRSVVVAALSPSWRVCSSAKESFSQGYYISPKMHQEIEDLKLENHTLRSQLELLRAQVDLEKLVGQEAELLRRMGGNEDSAKRRKAEIFRLIDLYTPSMIGKVIFREAGSWSSSLWINLGEKTNQVLGKNVIMKNSPVVIGTTVLGIVEYVGQQRSRVRLITDSTLVPSVRVLRGSEQKKMIVQQARKLMELLAPLKEKEELMQLCQKFDVEGENFYLAKGELHGIRRPLMRSRHAVLQGVGFNYDFEDEEGPARDLRSEKIPLVKAGDILVTTGMDGIFPAGLRLAQVSQVYPLREGSTAYELDAKSLIGNFDDISFVTVLPPIQDN